MIEGFIAELEQETVATRRLLERVPEDRMSWKPHPRSMSLGQLALHVATTPGGVAEMSRLARMPMPELTQPEAASSAELLGALDESVEKAREVLAGYDDAALAETWTVVDGEKEVMAMPRAAVIRTILLNHWYHHRGQLTVYLRLLDVPLPSIYGPTADENPMAA